MDISWESIGLILSVITGTITILAKLNSVENDYQAGKNRQKDLENKLTETAKNLEIQQKEIGKLKAQIGREFNNIAWQLRILIGSLKDIEGFLEKSSGYTRRKSPEIVEDEDTRGYMLKKIKELDSSQED
ncbi:hypothetical protein [Oscillatoria acuminata]|uniref:Uncharacterized protein n=1 Tax=Oscillatoria acuminata PCC 6304 TaxID=56110 RepID=K9TCK8_9CYAN|nr:hypothetical protein [Oscillatoria acuminata]AFY80168.1 hypothetical protein Oscil6304_0418 [Oscillatoria acuminata PCC 6304]